MDVIYKQGKQRKGLPTLLFLLQTIAVSQKQENDVFGAFYWRKQLRKSITNRKSRRKKGKRETKDDYLNSVKEWTNIINGKELIHPCQEKEVWKRMIVDAAAHDTLRRKKKLNNIRARIKTKYNRLF